MPEAMWMVRSASGGRLAVECVAVKDALAGVARTLQLFAFSNKGSGVRNIAYSSK